MDPFSQEGVEALRARVHRMSDMLQTHEGALREHNTLITVLKENTGIIVDKSATREQLDALHRENTLRTSMVEAKIDTVKEDLKSIKGGINKLVWLVIGSVVAAIMTLIIAGPPKIGIAQAAQTSQQQTQPQQQPSVK